jgi:hypothetical protein
VKVENSSEESESATCLAPGETNTALKGQVFRYRRTILKGAKALMNAPNGDPLVTINRVGKGIVVFNALPHLLGLDERLTPFAAHMLEHVFASATPVQVTGDVECLINRNSRGWVVTVFNNNGVFKPQQGMAQVDRTAKVVVSLGLRNHQLQSAKDWITDRSLEVVHDSVRLELAPGAIAVVELVSGR